MSVTQYIGARYVPLFADPAEWTNERAYEPLTIVLHEGNSYTSKQSVPVGIDISNETFWALTGNYNAQIEAYRQEVAQYGSAIEANTQAIADEASARETADGELNAKIDALAASYSNIPNTILAASARFRTDSPIASSRSTSLQGGVKIGAYDLLAFRDTNGAANGRVQVWKNEQLINTVTLPIYHGNCINYCNESVYVACGDNATALKMSFDETSGNLGTPQTIDFTLANITNVWGIVELGDYYYVLDQYENIVRVPIDNPTTSEFVFAVPVDTKYGINQTISPVDDTTIMLTRSNPGFIYFINVENGEIVKRVEFSDVYDFCYFDEIEQAQFDGEMFYIYGVVNPVATANNVCERIVTAFKADIHNSIGTGHVTTYQGQSVFVNVDTTANAIPTVNTTGQAANNPFTVKYTCDVDAIYKALGSANDLRIKFVTDYPACLFLGNVNSYINVNGKILNSLWTRGGVHNLLGVAESFNAGNDTTPRYNGISQFMNCYNSMIVCRTNIDASLDHNVGTFNACVAWLRQNVIDKLSGANNVLQPYA